MIKTKAGNDMKTLKTLGYAGAGSIAIALMAPAMSFADAGQAPTANGSSSNSLVHRVSHSLAGSESYTSTSQGGYKWGRKAEQTESEAKWAGSTNTRSSYKWGDSAASETEGQSFAGTSSYDWGVQNFAEQSGYRWGLRNYADQTGYRWGLRNYSDQTGYRWGLRNYSDQTGYRWGLRSSTIQG